MSIKIIKTTHMSFKIKNKYINFLFKLLDIPLHGEERRERDAFIKVLLQKERDAEDERLSLLQELSKKDKNGKPIIKADNNYDLTPENLTLFQKELTDLMEAYFIIDIFDSNKKQISTVIRLFENTNSPLTYSDGKILDEIIEVMKHPEEVKDEQKKKLIKDDESKNNIGGGGGENKKEESKTEEEKTE